MVIGSLGGMRNTLLSALRAMPVCRAAAHILAARMQKASEEYFSPTNLLTLYKAQIRPSLEYCSHIWEAVAPTTLTILDAVQRRAIRLIGDPALTCHLQSLSHQHSNGFCSSELSSIIPPFIEPARCSRGSSSSHPKAVVLHTSRTEWYNIPGMSRAWNGLPGDVFIEPESVVLFKSGVNKLPLT
nr:unnamed protein product [Callosobruchus chinensis]